MKKFLMPTLLIAWATAGQATHIVFDGSGPARTVDTITGRTRELPTLAASTQASAVSSDGTIYLGNSGGQIFRYDPGTNATTLIGDNNLSIRGMSMIGTVLYAIVDVGLAQFDRLYTINTTTAAATLIGTTSQMALQSLGTGPDGRLYSWDGGSPSANIGLCTINPVTAASTDVNPSVGAMGIALQGLDMDGQGVMWGVSQDSLYRIDLGKGNARLVAKDIGTNLRAITIPRTRGRMLAVDGNSRLWDIDLATGAGTQVTSGAVASASLASMPDGRLWTEFLNRIALLDPGSGSKTSLTTAVNAQSGLTAVGQTLYGVNSVGAQFLTTFNLTTGAPTSIGSTGRNATITALTTDSNGAIYAWDTTLGLMTINKVTGVATDVSATGADSRISAIEFGTDGTLYGAGTALFILSKTSGAVVRTIGTGTYSSLRSMAAMPLNGRALGIDNAGELFQVDLVTPGSSVLHSTTQSHSGLTTWPEGPGSTINNQVGLTRIQEVNTVSGVFSGSFTPSVDADCDALCNSDSLMYVFTNTSPTQANCRGYNYYTGDLISTSVVSVSSEILAANATRDGSIFGLNAANGLMQIDPISGGAFGLDSTPPGTNQFALMVLPDGRMYAGSGPTLFTVNPLNGDQTLIGNIGMNSRGLTWAPPKVHGGAALEDWSGPNDQVLVEVEIRHAGTTEPVETHLVHPLSVGNIQFGSNLFGTYDITIKPKHWLRRTFTNVLITGSGALYGSASYINGDADNDNEVAIGDYAALSSALNSSLGDPNYDAMADFNGDQSVDIGDYAILSANFGLSGED